MCIRDRWYRRDKDGIPMDSGAVFATGKVIYVDGDLSLIHI